MPFAARVGDMTSHGTPLGGPTPAGLGSFNVFIGGKSAWRAVVDIHPCPQATGVVPHLGGNVAIGSKSVFINKFPAVRQGDKIVEAGPPNMIAAGCPNVLIGE